MTEKKITIIHQHTKDEPYLIILKPRGLASAPLQKGDDSALTQALNLFPELNAVTGKKNVEAGLVHRIDTETEGLILIAANQDFYEYIQQEQAKGNFIKTYNAVCREKKQNDISYPEYKENVPIEKEFFIESFFRPYGQNGAQVRPVTQSSGRAALKKAGTKVYSTLVRLKKAEKDLFYAECKIKAGYRHQVRCHLAWCGYPIKGDKIYGLQQNDSLEKTDEKMLFFATGLSFTNPVTGEYKDYHIDNSSLILI